MTQSLILRWWNYFAGQMSRAQSYWAWTSRLRAVGVFLMAVTISVFVWVFGISLVALWEYVLLPMLRLAGPILLRLLVVIAVMWIFWGAKALSSVLAVMLTLWMLGGFFPALRPLGNAILITPLFWVWSGKWQMPKMPRQQQNRNP